LARAAALLERHGAPPPPGNTGLGLETDSESWLMAFRRFLGYNNAPLDRLTGLGGAYWGFSLEAFATRALSRHFGIKAGVTFDSVVETNSLQPVVLGAFRF
jgi:hypothetical protein